MPSENTMEERFNKNHKAVLDSLLLQQDHVKAGKMSGYPAYYAGKTLYICLYNQRVGEKTYPLT